MKKYVKFIREIDENPVFLLSSDYKDSKYRPVRKRTIQDYIYVGKDLKKAKNSWIPHLMPDPASQGRKSIVLERLNRIGKEVV